MAHDEQRNDRGLAGRPREYDDGRAHPRRFAGDVFGDEPGRDRRRSQDDREGFWGRGHRDTGFERDEYRDYSREDYGASDRGADERGRGYGGTFGQTGEEGRGGQGYGWQRDFGREISVAASAMAVATGHGPPTVTARVASAGSSTGRPTRFPLGAATVRPSVGASRTIGAAARRATSARIS